MNQKNENLEQTKQIIDLKTLGYTEAQIESLAHSELKDNYLEMLKHHQNLISLGLIHEEICKILEFKKNLAFILKTLPKLNYLGFSKKIALDHYIDDSSQMKVFELLDFCGNILFLISKYPERERLSDGPKTKKSRINKADPEHKDLFRVNQSSPLYLNLTEPERKHFWYMINKYARNYATDEFKTTQLLLKIIKTYSFFDFEHFIHYFETKFESSRNYLGTLSVILQDLIKLDCLQDYRYFHYVLPLIYQNESLRKAKHFLRSDFTQYMLPIDSSQKTFLINLFIKHEQGQYLAEIYQFLTPYLNSQNNINLMDGLARLKEASILPNMLVIINKLFHPLFNYSNDAEVAEFLLELAKKNHLSQIKTIYILFSPIFNQNPFCHNLVFFGQFINFAQLILPHSKIINKLTGLSKDAFTMIHYQALTCIVFKNQRHPHQMFLELKNYLKSNMVSKISPGQAINSVSLASSSSEFAQNLFDRYGAKLVDFNPYDILARIRCDTHSTPLKKEAASLAFKRIVENGEGDFYDSASKINLQQLLYLSYLALYDYECHGQSETHATITLIKVLYTLERGNNLNEAGIDDLSTAKPIEIVAQFNQLITTLQGLDPDTSIKALNHHSISTQFTIKVRTELYTWLRHQGAASLEYYSILKEPRHPEYDACFAKIWLEIAEVVKTQILNEFSWIEPSVVEKLCNNYSSIDLGPCLQKLEDEMSPSTRASLGFFCRKPAESNQTGANLQSKF